MIMLRTIVTKKSHVFEFELLNAFNVFQLNNVIVYTELCLLKFDQYYKAPCTSFVCIIRLQRRQGCLQIEINGVKDRTIWYSLYHRFVLTMNVRIEGLSILWSKILFYSLKCFGLGSFIYSPLNWFHYKMTHLQLFCKFTTLFRLEHYFCLALL